MKTFCLFLFLALALFADEEEEDLSSLPLTITHHHIELASGPLAYTAVTGMCPIFGPKGDKEAELFFISYAKDQETDRPITFVFPGGPGAAGTLESILAFGPRRLLTAGEGRTTLPPYKIIDNPQTILEYTDLVFIDPVQCGFSRVAVETDPDFFFSVEGDIQTLGEFIHTYIDYAQRWNSPIYLAGASYGTLRCCGLASNLFQYGIAVKGIVLNGCAFDLSITFSERDHALPDCLLVPTFAATAWHHGRLWPEKTLQDVVEEARRFIYEDYAPFMLQPSRFNAAERGLFEQKLAHLVGLPVDTVRRYNCRLNEHIYTAEFFGAERKVLGSLDTRYSGDISTIDPNDSHDPSYLDSLGYAPAFKYYLQKELNTHFPFSKYVSFSRKARHSWNFFTHDSWGAPNFLQRLRHTLIINPLMKVFVGSGYYDCRTPFATAEYCFDHLDLPPSYKSNLQFEYYESGHGFIFDYPSLQKFKTDLTQFYGH